MLEALQNRSNHRRVKIAEIKHGAYWHFLWSELRERDKVNFVEYVHQIFSLLRPIKMQVDRIGRKHDVKSRDWIRFEKVRSHITLSRMTSDDVLLSSGENYAKIVLVDSCDKWL